LSDEWLILRSIEDYQVRCKHQLKKRATETPVDSRAILYGEPLFDFILRNVQLLNIPYASDVSHALVCRDSPNTQSQQCEPNVQYALANAQPPEDEEVLSALTCRDIPDNPPPSDTDEPRRNLLYEAVVDIHRRWLMTPRDDLNGQSPREVLFAKRELIDLDLDSRMNQWSYFLEEPPCLSRDSHAYRYAGFGTHEWIMYYDLVRFLIWEAVEDCAVPAENVLGAVNEGWRVAMATTGSERIGSHARSPPLSRHNPPAARRSTSRRSRRRTDQ